MKPPVVLIVEDNPTMRDTLIRVVEAAGMEVITTDRGENVLRMIRQTPPEIAVLDVDLAGTISGVDVLRGIKSNPKTSGIPVILHTSESGIGMVPEAALADLTMMKPADPDDLVKMIKRLVNAKRRLRSRA